MPVMTIPMYLPTTASVSADQRPTCRAGRPSLAGTYTRLHYEPGTPKGKREALTPVVVVRFCRCIKSVGVRPATNPSRSRVVTGSENGGLTRRERVFGF